MKILDLLKDVSIDVNATCSNKDEAIDTLVSLMAKQGNLNNQDVYKQGIYAREELSTTGIGEGIAIPHAQSEAVNAPGLAAMVVKDGVDYQSLDNQPAKLFFMIAVPKTGGNEHLQILAMLSQMLMDTDFKDSLINAQSVEEFMDLINQKEAAQKAKEEEKEEGQRPVRPDRPAVFPGAVHRDRPDSGGGVSGAEPDLQRPVACRPGRADHVPAGAQRNQVDPRPVHGRGDAGFHSHPGRF